MPRDQYFRRKKFAAKLDGSVAEIRADAYATPAKALHAAAQGYLVPQEEAAKLNILEPAGVSVNEIPFYLDSMREFCKCCRNFTSTTRNNECYNIYRRWLAKGMVSNLLILLAHQCGCDLWAYYEY